MCGYTAGQGCSNTDYNNSFLNSDDPATIEYDNFVSALASTAIRTSDGGFQVWGRDMANNGTSNVLSPRDLNGTNYSALGSATVYKVTIGSNQKLLGGNPTTWEEHNQSIALASNGLYAWGTRGTVLDASLTTNAAFRKLTIGGKADGLPAGVSPQDVKMMTASGGTVSSPTSRVVGTLVIVTCSGDVWVLSRNAQTRGNGATGNSTTWSRVEISAGNYLTGVVAARTQGGAVIALKTDGTLWTWGLNTYLGNNSATANRSRATQMTAPSSGTVKMIGITSGTSDNTHAYYALMTDGNLWAIGNNDSRQIGDWSYSERRTWVQPRYTSTSGQVMNNIKWIDPQENDYLHPAINVLTNSAQLYAWGVTVFGMTGIGIGGYRNPAMPGGVSESDRILAVETGGKHSMIIKECTSTFGYTGEQQDGSMGDGTTTWTPHAWGYVFETSSVEMCAAETEVSIVAPYTVSCSFSTVQLTGYPEGGTWSVTSGSATVDTSGLVTLSDSGNSVVQYTAASACNGTTTATITLTANSVTPGVIATDQTVNSGGDPAPFTIITAATGSGTLTYQWQSSTDDGSTWTDISGATSATYNPPAGITVTTLYRRAVSSTLSGVVCTDYSNVVTITVNPPCNAGDVGPVIN